MIYGIGIDIVDVRRFRDIMDRYPLRFAERVFTSSEISYCGQKHSPEVHFAARFAAKEAVIKAIGRRIPFREIEVRADVRGKPLLYVNDFKDGYRWHISIAHDGNYSVAYVIMEGNNREDC